MIFALSDTYDPIKNQSRSMSFCSFENENLHVNTNFSCFTLIFGLVASHIYYVHLFMPLNTDPTFQTPQKGSTHFTPLGQIPLPSQPWAGVNG